MPKLNRNLAIAGSVVLFHLAALWALQTGLLRRPADIVIPVQILGETISPPAPKVEAAPARQVERPPTEPPVKRQAAARRLVRESPPAPRSTAISDAKPVPSAPVGVLQHHSPAPPPAIDAPAAEPRPAGPAAPAPAPAKLELPSSAASYLQNPALVYPPISKRMGEQGKVVVRVLIGADGMPEKAELMRSSGFERLDQAALDYVRKCRYVPGKIGGVPQAMWYEAPLSFVLE